MTALRMLERFDHPTPCNRKVIGLTDKPVTCDIRYDTLIEEADAMPKKARWKFGHELINLSPRNSSRRTLRINLEAVLAYSYSP